MYSLHILIVLEGKVLLGNLLEAKDDGTGLSISHPSPLLDERGARGLVFRVLKDALEVGVCGGSLDGDGVSGLDEGLDDGGGEGSVLERLLLGTEEDGGISRHVGGLD
jgi:hypothetical protein